MDRTRRDKPEDKQRTSELIQQLAAQRERKLQGISSSLGHSTTATEVAAASSIPLPSSFDEDELQSPAQADGAATGKPRSRLVRQDKARQTSTAAGLGADEVDGLADLLQGVGLSGSAVPPSAQQQQRQAQGSSRHDSNNSSSQEDAIEGDDDPEFQSSTAAAQRRRTAGTSSSRSATQAAPPADEHSESEHDLASVDSADSDADSTGGASSNTQQQDRGGSSAAAAAEPLVYDGGFKLDGAVARKLYPHQFHGVKWLWSLHR